MSKPLNSRQQAFVDEYLKDLKPVQAAKRAGYADTTAAKKAPLWVCKSRESCPANMRHVWDAVAAAKKSRSEITNIDAEFVLRRLLESVEADTGEIYNEQGGLKPIHEWPPIFRTLLVSSIDVEQQFVYDNGERIPDGYVTKIKLVDKTKLLKMLGDHTDIQAFIKNLNVGVDTGLAKRMEQARKRASNIE